MNTKTLYWDVEGNIEQEFELGNIREITKDDMYNTTFRISGFEAGVPYQFRTSVYNRHTNTYYDDENATDEYVWFTSNLDGHLFTREHAYMYNVSAHQDNSAGEVVINIQNTMSETLLETLNAYSVRFDLYAEPVSSSSSSICLHTYALHIKDPEEDFVIRDIDIHTTYTFYYSLLISVNTVDWSYVLSHHPVTSEGSSLRSVESVVPIPRNIHPVDKEDKEESYLRYRYELESKHS